MRGKFLTRTFFCCLVMILLLAPGGVGIQGAYQETKPENPQEEMVDYLIIVPTSAEEPAVGNLVTWKEQTGLRVKVVTLTTIYTSYTTGDFAERIWNYLHDNYQAWGLRYLLLVGDIDQLPMRFLYPDGGPGDGLGYPSDYYYAKLDVDDWDIDNDNRWGEFTHDQLDLHADVIVGRLPFNDIPTIQNFANNVVAFESDTGAWKRSALLSHGVWDIANSTTRTDNAVLGEQLAEDFFDPHGWTLTRHYEQNGLSPSSYTSDGPISQTLFNNVLGINTQSIVNVVMHGQPYGMSSLVWQVDGNNNGKAEFDDPENEGTYSNTSSAGHISVNPTSGIVFLGGCSSAVLFGDDPNVARSPLRSRYLVSVTRDNTMVKEYLEHGAPVVIGTSAGTDYKTGWQDVSDDSMQGLNYLFYANLIYSDKRVGEAFYAAQQQSAERYGLLRGVRDYNYFGDPALLLKGIEEHPGGLDSQITEGSYKTFAADYDDNGDLYVAVLVDNPSGDSSAIDIFRSTDHGENWSQWTTVDEDSEIAMDVDLLVSRYQGEITEERLHVFYSTESGRLMHTSLDLSDPDIRDSTTVATLGQWAKNISVARDPVAMPGIFNIYLTWEYEIGGNYRVTVYRSDNNGHTWLNTYNNGVNDWPYMLMPSIEAGPGGHVYLAFLVENLNRDVMVFHSTDGAVTWPHGAALTASDGATTHTSPDVAVSTDPAFPAVWVAYDYNFQDPTFGYTSDLRFAYSTDHIATWTYHKGLSSDVGVNEWLADMAGYRPAPNRWVNLAYNLDTVTTSGYSRQVLWRWASGGLPANWSARRTVNSHESGAPFAVKPLVIYSPGSSVGGSGVVYGGANHQYVYFSAPWLPGIGPQPPQAAPQVQQVSEQSIPLTPMEDEPPPLVWQPLGNLPEANTASGLAIGADGALYAAGSTTGSFSSRGRVYRSEDGGASWALTGDLPESWSLSSLLRSQGGALLAGGMSLDLSDPENPNPSGMIYRSENNGLNWEVTHSQPEAAVYRLYQAPDGSLFAGSGWSGILLHSDDDGASWNPWEEFGGGISVRGILSSSSGHLLAGLQTPDGGAIYSLAPGAANRQITSWLPANGLDGVTAVYDLAESDGWLYAATSTLNGGRIYRAGLDGLNWSVMEEPNPAVMAFRRLYVDSLGQIFAGADQGYGPSATLVFRLGLDGQTWQPYHGWLDLSQSIYDLMSDETGLLAAGGHVYGEVYRVLPTDWSRVFLPMVIDE